MVVAGARQGGRNTRSLQKTKKLAFLCTEGLERFVHAHLRALCEDRMVIHPNRPIEAWVERGRGGGGGYLKNC